MAAYWRRRLGCSAVISGCFNLGLLGVRLVGRRWWHVAAHCLNFRLVRAQILFRRVGHSAWLVAAFGLNLGFVGVFHRVGWVGRSVWQVAAYCLGFGLVLVG